MCSSESGGEKDVVHYLLVIIKIRKIMKLHLCIQVIFCLQLVLRDVAADINTNASLESDTNLMFEILLGGVEIDQDNNIVLLDKEMASMRQGRTFLSQINDNIPRSLSSMVQMASTLESQKRRRPLPQSQFKNLVLSMVYSAHQAWHQESKEKKEAWGEVLFRLANITVCELRGNYLFNYA